MKPRELYSKAINESLSLMRADIEILRKRRGKKFLIKDLKPYLDVVMKMASLSGQEDSVFSLHKNSVENHYRILSSLAETIEYADEPYTEHLQGPALIEILYEKDHEFRKFVEKFIKVIGEHRAIISEECIRKYRGFYGPVCVADFALTPGSTANLLSQILRRMKLSERERYYAHVILASKSWGMNTSYVFGWRFMDALGEGKTEKKAVDDEIEMLGSIFDHPMKAQQDMMNSLGAFPFGAGKYLREYKKGMKETVEDALIAGVNYSNILAVPAYAVGDIGHHLCQSSYDLYKDDFTFDIVNGVFGVVEKTLRKNAGSYENLYQVLSLATGSSAASIVYLLESEGFTSDMVIRLMMERFRNFIQRYPYRGVGIEFHNVDFMDVVYRGNKILHDDGGGVGGMAVDLSPLSERGILRDFKGCVYPNCSITRIFSSLMRISDHFCLPNIEPVTMGLLTNIISIEPEKSMSPMRGCKKCAVSSVMPERCNYCERKRVV